MSELRNRKVRVETRRTELATVVSQNPSSGYLRSYVLNRPLIFASLVLAITGNNAVTVRFTEYTARQPSGHKAVEPDLRSEARLLFSPEGE